MRFAVFALAAGSLFVWPLTGYGQVIGSYDNFDCFNDTGETAEGFEIDVEDVASADLTREFPSNFSATPWVSRYGVPKVTSYDFTSATPDTAHSYDAGHKGVLITWAASLVNGQWVAAYGSQAYSGTVAGNGTPFVAAPTYTNGDSCWFYGLGNAYPASGCDHFGISFASGVIAGRMTYHWKTPDAINRVLVNAQLEASIPPSPTLILSPPVAPNAPPVIKAVARAPADVNHDPAQPQEQDPLYGDAVWEKVTTIYGAADAVRDNLQKANVRNSQPAKRSYGISCNGRPAWVRMRASRNAKRSRTIL